MRVLPVGRHLDDLLPLLGQFPCKIVEDSPDLVLCHGGDGTLLGAERDYPGIPKFPLRDRRNNPKCPRHNEQTLLADFFAGRLAPGRLVKLRGQIAGRPPLLAINDLVLTRPLNSAAIRFRVLVNGRPLQPLLVADSVIVATPFGSTGYFLSITRGSFQAGLGLAYNNAMEGQAFNVVAADSRLEIQLLRGPAVLGADNNPSFQPLENGESVTIAAEDVATTAYGLEAFRCHECYLLRRNGLNPHMPSNE